MRMYRYEEPELVVLEAENIRTLEVSTNPSDGKIEPGTDVGELWPED